MDTKSKMMAVITDAIIEVNQTLPEDKKISLEPDAQLYGPQGNIDSLTLTLLIVAIEQNMEQAMQVAISLVDYSTGLGQNNPFLSIHSLADYLITLMGEKKNEA